MTTTSGEALYSARGLSQTVQDTVISTRLPQLATRNVSESRSFTSSSVVSSQLTAREAVRNEVTWRNIPRTPPRDPIAQTFIIDNAGRGVSSSGVFLSKVDLFFGSKDASRPVFIEIREVDPTSSFVTNKIIPFSQVTLEAADINTSTDGSAPTPVNFNTPIYLKDQTEYAIVIKPAANNPNTSLFVGRLGESDLITTQRIVQQPGTGTLLDSSNFVVYRVGFAPGTGISNHVAFSGVRTILNASANTTSVATATTWNNIDFNANANVLGDLYWYNTEPERLTVRADGYYKVRAFIETSSAGSNDSYTIALRRTRGVTTTDLTSITMSANDFIELDEIFELQEDDYVELMISNSDNTGAILSTSYLELVREGV